MHLDRFRNLLVLYLVLSLVALSLPAHGWAMFLPAPQDGAIDRDRVRAALETSLIKQRLADYGLSAEEAASRIDALSDEQVHRIAANLDSLQAGGSVLGDVVFILLVVVLVIAILELTGHHVVVRH